MGEPIDYAKADKDPALYEDYQGKRYYFCCAACDEKFKEDPEKYIKEPAQPKKPEGSGTKE
ncbi:MAG: YHS domain-containing protein [Planctomycetes bacterium]|nr:YHS domain-containing protein [Planctomycetota bacterium]